jgi:hypothetical protein
MDVPNDAIRAMVDAVGKSIRVRLMPAKTLEINRVNTKGPKIKLTALAYPYPEGFLDRAMVMKAQQLIAPLKPDTKPHLSVVLGVMQTCTKEEFYLAIEEEK